MPLSIDLHDKNLMFKCPNCHKTIIRRGSWIKSITTFKCEGCRAKVRMTYGQKLAIFEHHRRLAAGGIDALPDGSPLMAAPPSGGRRPG